MTRTLSVEEEIRRPAGEVWEALTDWENAHRWMPGIEAMSAEGETAEGTKLTVHGPRRGALERNRPLRRGQIDRTAVEYRAG